MRADELNTGDYVRWTPKNIGSKSKARIVKVTKTPYGDISVWFKNDYYMPSLDSLSPIEITPDLLDKNGFCCTEWVEDDKVHHKTYSHVGDGTEVVTMDFADDGVVEVEVANRHTHIISRDICYLHLLQHILTIVGIWKEIVP